MSELDDLKKEVAKLKEQLNPPPREPSTHPRYDPTAGMSMPPSAIKAMMDAVPESVMRGLVNDAFKPNRLRAFLIPNTPPKSSAQADGSSRDQSNHLRGLTTLIGLSMRKTALTGPNVSLLS
jgi:hypothetical protein